MTMEITKHYSACASSYADHSKKDVTRSEEGKAEIKAENHIRKTAADELSYLSEKYENCTFIAANYKKGMRYGSMATTNIVISPAFLKKMADNPELEKEYESYFADMQRLDAENVQSHAAGGRRIVAQGWAIDQDGGIRRWGISEPGNARHIGQKMNDYADKIRKERAEKKKEQDKVNKKRQEAKAAKAELPERKEKAELISDMNERGKELFREKYCGTVFYDEGQEKRNTDDTGSIAVDIKV